MLNFSFIHLLRMSYLYEWISVLISQPWCLYAHQLKKYSQGWKSIYYSYSESDWGKKMSKYYHRYESQQREAGGHKQTTSYYGFLELLVMISVYDSIVIIISCNIIMIIIFILMSEKRIRDRRDQNTYINCCASMMIKYHTNLFYICSFIIINLSLSLW